MEKTTWSLETARERFIKYCREDERYAEGTVENYTSDIDSLCAFLMHCTGTPDRVLNAADVIRSRYIHAYIDYLTYIRKLAPSTIRRHMSTLRTFIRFLYQEGVIPHLFELKALGQPDDQEEEVVEPFTPEEEREFIRALYTKTSFPRRDGAIFLLMYQCHLTTEEILNLTVDDVDLRAATVTVSARSGVKRVLPLPLDVQRALALYLAFRPKVSTNALFLNRARRPITKGVVNHAINQLRTVPLLCEMRITPRRIRLAGIAKRIQAGWTPAQLKQHLNVKSKATILKYFEQYGLDHDVVEKEEQV